MAQAIAVTNNSAVTTNWVGKSVSQMGQNVLSDNALKELDRTLSAYPNVKLIIMDNQSALSPGMARQLAQTVRGETSQTNISSITGLEDSFVVILQLGKTLATSRVSLVTSAHHKKIQIQPSAQEILDKVDQLLSSASTRGKLEQVIPRAIQESLLTPTYKAEKSYAASIIKLTSSLDQAQEHCQKMLHDLKTVLATYPEFSEPINQQFVPAVKKLQAEFEMRIEQVPCLELGDLKPFLLQSDVYFQQVSELKKEIQSTDTFLKKLANSRSHFETIANSWGDKSLPASIGNALNTAKESQDEVICSWYESTNSSQAIQKLQVVDVNLSQAYLFHNAVSFGQVAIAGVTALMVVLSVGRKLQLAFQSFANQRQRERQLHTRLIEAESTVQELGIKLLESNPGQSSPNIFVEHRPFWKRLFDLEQQITKEKRKQDSSSTSHSDSDSDAVLKLLATESRIAEMQKEFQDIISLRK